MVLEVVKKEGESSRSVVQRFTRALRHSGILNRIKRVQFYQRPLSKTKKKKKALRGLEIQRKREEMKKLGKNLK